MLNEKGFDLWADGYDRSVGLSADDGTYPFAGYREILGAVYERILTGGCKKVLDIGFGTGTLSARLYENGCEITGQDFSGRMIEIARLKMPDALLYHGDFSEGLVPDICRKKYDAIIATYSLHHLDDVQKIALIKQCIDILNPGGQIFIGDVAFETRRDLENCRIQTGKDWDDDEIYFAYDEIKTALPQMEFEKFSHCAGLMTIKK